MDIKQLTYFVQIAIEENYSAASRKLFVSQPALSKVVKNLEQELGVKLFYSADRKTRLTDEGQAFFVKAQKLIEDYHALIASTHQDGEVERGRFVLGMPPIVGSCFFSRLVTGFQTLYPGIDISIVEKGANALQEDVFTGVIDIGCAIMPIFSNQFEISPLIYEKNMVVVNENHRLASRSRVSVADLAEETFVIFDEDFTLHRQIIAACRDAGFDPNIAVTSSQWDFLVELVSQNRGISILPRPILKKYEQPHVRLLEIDHDLGQWNVALISRKGRYMPSACKKFMDYLQEYFHESV